MIEEAEEIPQPGPDPSVRNSADDDALLREIRQKYRYYKEAWKDAHEHREKLMRYLSGHPWDETEEKAREGRPSISHDELNQYIFQCVNSARQNKRGIKIEPDGNGATDKTAELRENLARTIEYRSQAQGVYLQGFQDCVEGSYGWFRVGRRYISDDSDDQEIYLSSIPNPDSVLYDPDCKKPDWSDAKGCFVLDPMPLEEFKAEHPDADLVSFPDEDGLVKKDWVLEKHILRAEYWKVKTAKVRGKSGRMVDKKTVIQYITNGIQILEENPQIDADGNSFGDEIPIVSIIGLQRYEKKGETAKRCLYALGSFALDAQKSLAYFVSLEAEQAGLTPKIPYIGYVGQFETDADAWEESTKVPRAMLQVDVVVDGAGGALPLPQRIPFGFQSLEVEKESARRAIQAGMATTPLPTQAQRQNEKSGVALQKIAASSSLGSYHFVSSLEAAITRAGRIINSWIPTVYDTERDVYLHQADDKRVPVTLNAKQPDEQGKTNRIGDESHDVTVGTAPSNDSQRDAASDFLDLLVSNMEQIPQPGTPQAKLLAMAIEMKQLGPKGDEMAEVISPDPNQPIPPQAQQAIQKGQQEMQAMHAYAQQLEGKVQELAFEKKADIVRTQGQIEIKRMELENDLAKAEVTTKYQSMEERIKFVENMWAQFHQQAHERGMQAEDHSQAQQVQQADQEHQQSMPAVQAAAQPEPEMAGATA